MDARRVDGSALTIPGNLALAPHRHRWIKSQGFIAVRVARVNATLCTGFPTE